MALTANQDWLYKQMSGKNVDLGSEEQFAQAMQDESNRQWVYEQAGKMGIDLGTPEQFASAMTSVNPRVKDFPAPTNEEEYQANLRMQAEASGATTDPNHPFVEGEKLRISDVQRPQDYEGEGSFYGLSDEDLNKQIGEYDQRRTVAQEAMRQQQRSRKRSFAEQLAAIDNPALQFAQDEIEVNNVRLSGEDEERYARLQQEKVWRERNSESYQELGDAILETRKLVNSLRDQNGRNIDSGGASAYLDKAIKLYQAPSKYGQQSGFNNWAEGLGAQLSDYDTYTLGITEAFRAGNMAGIVKKLNKGEDLTDQEQANLQSFLLLSMVEQARKQDLSTGYTIGKQSAESIPFMLEMLATAGLGAAGEKALVKSIVKSGNRHLAERVARMFGDEYMVTAARKKSGKIVKDIALNRVEQGLLERGVRQVGEDVLMTAAMPTTWASVNNDRVNEMLFSDDHNYGFMDFMRSFTSATLETGTERWGGKIVDKTLSKVMPFDKIWGKQKWGLLLSNDFIHSPFGETGEEYINAIASAVRSVNPLYSDKSNEQLRAEAEHMFTPAGFAQTFLTVAPMSAFGGAANVAVAKYNLSQYQNGKAGVVELLTGLGATTQQAENIIKQIESSEDSAGFAGKVAETERILLLNYQVDHPNATKEEYEAFKKQVDKTVGAYFKGAAYLNELTGELRDAYATMSEEDKQRCRDAWNEYVVAEFENKTPEETTEQEAQVSPAAAEHQRAVDEVTQAVGERTHGNGYIYPVAMPGNAEKTGYIVGEVVPVIDESNPEQLRIENDDVVTVKWSDGTVTQERARDLDLIGDPMLANEVIDADVENQMNAYTQQRIQNGEHPVLMRDKEGILKGFFPTEGGLLEDQNGVQYTPEQLAEQGWQETKPVLFVNDTQQIAALDNGDGTYTQVDALGNPIAEPMSAEAFSEQGFAMVPLEEEQPKSQAPVEAPVVQQAPVEQAPEVQQPEVQEPAAPVVPNIETMSAEELGGSTVEYMGDRASAMAYLEAERDKADAEVQRTSKLKVTRFNGPEDFKRQNDQIQAAKRAAIDRYNKLQNAITAANAYKTLAEQKEEAERKAREAALREQRRQLAEAETAGDIEAKWQNTKKTVGFAATKTLPNGQKVNGHYILTEAGDVVPSHDPRKNYADSEGYVMENGQNVNDNNYKDPDVQRIALDIAQNYGGQAVEQMPFLENRAGRVLSGNNRTISGIIAAENNTDQAYLAALAENAQQYGFTPEQLAEYQHPRLQFVVEDELPFTTGTFAMFNQQEKKTKSSVNRAVANSKMVTEAVRDKMLEIMDQYESLDSFFGSESAASDIVQALITEGLMTQQEVAGLTENTGTGFKFGQSGREYVTDMLLGTLFDEQTIKMLAGEKTLKQAILRALPSIVANRRLKGYELTDSINNAIQLLYEARKANEGKSTADAFQLYLRQVDAFKGSVMDRYSGFDIILANRMSAGVEQLREILGLYNNSAMNEANGQMGFFEPRTIDDIKQDVYEYYTNQQPELAAALDGAAARGAQPESAVPSGVADAPETRQEVEDKIVPERPNSKPLQGMSYNVAEAEDMLGRMVRNILDENGYEDVEIVGVKVIGSRVNGDAREDSDLDAIVEFKGNAREDSLFNLLHEQPIEIEGVTVDINPITEGKSGTIEQFMRRSDEYLAEKAAKEAKEQVFDADELRNQSAETKQRIDATLDKLISSNMAEIPSPDVVENMSESEAREIVRKYYNGGYAGGFGQEIEQLQKDLHWHYLWLAMADEEEGKPTDWYDNISYLYPQSFAQNVTRSPYKGILRELSTRAASTAMEQAPTDNRETTETQATEQPDITQESAERDFIGKDISDVRATLGHWWTLDSQNVSGATNYYFFNRAGYGRLQVITDNNNIVKSVLFSAIQPFQDKKPKARRTTRKAAAPTAEPVQQQPAEQPKEEPKNTIFTEEEAERVRARMRARRNRLNMGIDPEQFADGVFMAGYYMEKGVRKFADFARAMLNEFGEWVRPYLKQWYMGLRYDPRAVGADFVKDMDDIATVDTFDIDNFDANTADNGTEIAQSTINEENNVNNSPENLQESEKISTFAGENSKDNGPIEQSKTEQQESPMMKQFQSIKEQYPDATLMFRVGDFYELYEEDAVEASKILGITLTKRKDGRAFAGFPFHALDTYLPKLVRAGKRVAICDQLEDPKKAKGLVKRGVSELVTPGTPYQETPKVENAEVAEPESVTDNQAPTIPEPNVVTDTVGEITESTHTKTGTPIWVVKPLERVSDAEFRVLRRRAKENNGYYSTFVKGYVFNSVNDATRFNNISDEQTTTEQTSADTKAIISTAEATAAEAAAIGESAGEELKQPAIEKIDAATEQIDDQVATLAGIETRVEEVPELPANATVADILDQAQKRSTRNKQLKKRKEELQQVLDLFADEPINEEDNGNTNQDTEGTSGADEEEPAAVGGDGTQSDGRPQAGTAQEPSGAQDSGVVADGDTGEIGGETQPTTATGSQQSRSKRGSASGPFGRVSSGNVERKQSLKLSYRDEFGVEHILDANYYTLGDVYHINDRLNGDQYNVKAFNVLKNIKSKVWTEIAVTDPTIEHGDTRTDDHSLRTPKEKNTPLNTRNYLYPEDAGAIDNMTPSERMLANVEALETLRNLMVEGREATPEERAILGKLRGWGGVNVPDNYQAKYNRLTLTDVQKRLVDVVNQLDPDGERKLLDSLRTASLTSYYTPIPIARAMHAVAAAAGYNGNGNMLDPSMGNGVFEGSMPKGMQQSTNIRGVELDWLTGQIAQRLYPDARINITGFQDAHIPQDYYDYVISNIPFGSLQITDLDWKRNPSPIRKAAQGKIHNYFAVKMIESTRPGGLCVIMTSNAIMDTNGNQIIREYITDNCEVLGAVRLPNNTFKGAGTKVVTDVIFLRKFRNAEDRRQFMERADYWSDIATPFIYTDTKTLEDKNGNPHEVTYSKYYQEYSNNLMGKPFAGGQYSDDAFDSESILSTEDLAKQLEAIGKRIMSERKDRFGAITVDTTIPKADIKEKLKEAYKGDGHYESSGNIVVQDGKIGKLEAVKEGNGKRFMFEEQKLGNASVAQVTDYINLRTLLKQLIQFQIENEAPHDIDGVRKQMQDAYTAYVKKYGKLQEKKNAFISEDIDGFQVRALEQWKDGKFVGMADIYTKNTIASESNIYDTRDPQEAVLNSLASFGHIYNDYMQAVLGDNFAEQCAGLIFEDPAHRGEYIARDMYLSGDVVTKLEYARQIAEEDKRFQPNVDALESVQPKRKEYGEFPCHMGARWIPVQIYNDFLNDIFGIQGSWKGQKTGIVYMETTNEYIFNFDSKEFGGKASNYATKRKSPQDIFQAALLDKDITVTYKDEDGKEHVDQEATDAARDKVAELRDAFEDWVPQNQERVQQLTDTYNSVFNRHVLPTYNGQHLNIVGLQGMTLRPHQKDAVWRIINQRGGIIDHIVGAGKSLVMQASIMEMRRMGIAKKPMILALKSTTQQIATEFHQAFPAARVLAPTEDDFSVKNRKRFLAQIAVNDYDCIILSHEQYSALDHTDHIKRSFIEDQISQLDNLLEYLYGQKEQTQLTKKQAKGLEKRKENLKEKLKNLDLIRTDEEFVFENLGVDYLFVDECQAFKNLMFQTSYRNIAGLGAPEGSERSTKLLYGVRALQEMHQGDKGTVFLSGTTITNSLSELYNIFNYLRPNEMARMGLNTFDAWASTFAVRSTEAEFGVMNELKEKSRFRKFEGLQELSRLYTEIADVRNDNNLELPKPKLHTVFVPIPISDTMKQINDAITTMVRENNGKFFGIDPVRKDKYPWSLSATNLAKQATLSPKLIDTKYDDENGKIFHVCENIAKIYKQFDAQKGVQLIFCDTGVPTPGKKYDAYTDIINRLTKDYGIPRSEIVDIHEANSDEKRQELFRKVNDGKVRILIGGTKNMGTGVNVQKRVVAMHHLDIPWTPADVNQRNGRGSRQGNEIARDYNNNQVDAYYYAVERTLDTYRYQLQDVKGKMIDNFKMANVGLDEFDEGSDEMSPAEMVAVLSGNPVILDKAKQDKLVDKLKRAQRSSLTEYARRRAEYDAMLQSQSNMEGLIRRNQEDIETLKRNGFAQDAQGNWTPLKVTLTEYERTTSGTTYDKATDAGKAIHERIKKTGTAYLHAYGISARVVSKVDDSGQTTLSKELEAITYSGIKYSVALSDDDTAAGQAMQNLLKKIYSHGESYKRRLEEINHKLDGADPGEYSFPKQAELDAALAKKREIDAEYNKLIVSDKKPKQTETTPEAQITNLDYPQFRNQNEAQQLATAALVEVLNDNTDLDVFLATDEEASQIMGDDNVEFSIRKEPAPKKTGIGYKVFYRGKDGKLYPPMVANPNGEATPVGVWLNADAAPVAGESKTGRPQVKAGGKGTQGGSGQLAYRPGWHLGEIPYALQFNRKDENGEKTLFPKDFVWAEVEYAADNDYQEEAMREGVNTSGKFQHSLAGLKHVPTDGFYRYRTNPNPATDPWIITGAMKVNRVLTNEEVDEIVRAAGREPQVREAMLTPDGTLYGWAIGDRIYLTKDGLNPNSPIHEYSHIWAKAMMRNNREGWQSIVDIFKGTPFWDEVVNDPNYQGLTTDDAICSEVLARYSGQRGAARMEETAEELMDEAKKSGRMKIVNTMSLINKVKDAIRKFWRWVGTNLFYIKHFDDMNDVADRVLYDMLSGTKLGDLQGGISEAMFSPEKQKAYSPTRSDIVTKALVQQANDSFRLMQSALKKVSADLRTINAIRTQQFEYDRKVVNMLLNLYNSLLQENSVWAGYMPDTTRRIATQIVHAIGKKDISAEVNTIMDHMVHAQAKAAQRQWDKLLTTPVDKINISGVVMQGKVALQGQHALKAMNEALDSKATIEQLEDQIAQLMDMEDNATDESLKLQYKGQWIGYTIAAQHLERIQHLVDERNQLDIELQAARSNRAIKPSARQQLVANIQQAMRDNYIAQADAYAQSAKDLAEYVTTQEEQAKDFIHRQDANRDKIRSYAQRDLEGLATNPNRNRTRGNIVRQIWDAFASPIRDLQSLLRLTGLHAPDGEGYLYNHFMRGWMDGADKERLGIVNAGKTLDAKISELTHGKYKTWEEAARKINDASHNMFTITMLNGVDGKDMPVTEDIPLSAGNALYIYAVNKMNDGRMKLAGMNITEDDVKALTDKVREQFGQEILDVVDWVQSEYFSQLRNRYNPTHEALFGAPMDAIENYFPLRINAAARQQNEDLSEPDTDAARLLAGTSTGAIKRRTKNSLPLDVRNADFFQEVIRHIAQMERWNAFAQWNRDANILFSDINFRNRIKGMNGTIYGSGDQLYNYMKDAFRVAIGTYKPKTDTFSEITLNIAKGVTIAKINFRVWTAMKQIASFPAFFTYMTDGVFVGSYLRNWMTPHGTMKWARENLPNFEKRVSKRDMGDMRLMQRTTDWQWNKRVLEWSQKYGMAANVYFDTLTCATGARAVYDSRLAEYLKKGYPQEQAEQRARQDAEQAFNTSQQSSEGAFMSAVQMDRNLVTAALTVFRTSPIQYTRNFFYHTRNLLRKFQAGRKEEQIAFRMGQYKNDGLTDEQARKAAEKDYNKSIRSDIAGFVVYGALLNILWRLVGQVPYLLFGDDDDKKKQILDEATSGGAWFSPFTGLLGGGIVESALDGNGSVADMFAPEMPFTQDVKRAGQYLENNKYAEFANQALSVAMQSTTGFDPQTAADVIQRIVTTIDSEEELSVAEQGLRISQALLSIPQSQYEQQLVDRVVADESEYDAALADYIRYQKVHTAPLTWWLRGEESDEKAEENTEKRFNKLLTERDKIKNPEDYEE